MSHTPILTPSASSSSSNFRSIFDAALNKYKRKTKNDLLSHQLTVQLEDCDSPGAILDLLNKQYNIQQFIQSRSDIGSSKQWLNTTVTVLCALSGTLGQGVAMVFSPAKVIFAGIGIFLAAAKNVGASQDTLVDLFDRIENFFGRLEIYVKVQLTEAMKNLIAKIMAEILGILAIATQEVRKGWGKKYLRKLLGKNDIEDALQRLEILSNDEARTATVQVLETTDSMDNKIEQVVDGIRETTLATQQVGNDLGDLRHWLESQNATASEHQLRETFYQWLSPPDPSINYNTARDAYHDGTAVWFTQGQAFQDWKTSGYGSLFWIHGKPGSGKSIISSAIVDDFKQSLDTRPSHMVYFFFDFKDSSKQDLRALQTSLLVQLCRQSEICFKALFDLYSTHDQGKQQPSESALSHCLKSMLLGLGQVPIYLIIDALDECPNISKSIGVPRSRQKVLEFLKELVELQLPNLYICVTSRPELDIRDSLDSLEHLARLELSLHDQDGQKKDIADYVRSVIYSDKEPVMKKWRQEIKDLVIKTLSQNADGMFRWVVCQLEMLRECLARNVDRVLNELPESLDETYLRVLKGIKGTNREDAYRLFQCLVVATRPLRVEELGEVLAVNFDSGEGIPKLNPDWRWEDQEEALQAACSSLVAIVDTGKSRVVQFSHFSVKEFLTSPRLADSSPDVSRYHISLEPAHKTLAQSCLGVLLRFPVNHLAYEDHADSEDEHSEDEDLKDEGWEGEDKFIDEFPLAEYAARYWVDHAQFGNVSSEIWKGLQLLFDPTKLHFSAWLRFYDIDAKPTRSSFFCFFSNRYTRRRRASPLYYAALCGFRDLAEDLMVRHLQGVNARGGWYHIPLGAALAGKHFHVAQLLYEHGAKVDARGDHKRTPLHAISTQGDPEIVQWLLRHGADTDIQANNGWTPLHGAAVLGNFEAAQLLVKHNADVKIKNSDGETQLHLASKLGSPDVVRLLLVHGADMNARSNDGSTPLHRASQSCWFQRALKEKLAVACLLLEHGADIRAVDNRGRTAFQVADRHHEEMIKLLSEHVSK